MLEKIRDFKDKILMGIKSKGFIIYIIAIVLMLAIKWPFEDSGWTGMWFGFFAGFILVTIESFEKYILNHITIIVFFSMFLFLTEPEKVSQYKDLYLLIGGLFAFWYGYKKYEVEKSKKILSEFITNSNHEFNTVINLYTNGEEGVKHGTYLSYIYQYFLLNQQGYIKHEDWRIIEKIFFKQSEFILSKQHEVVEGFLYDYINNIGFSENYISFIESIFKEHYKVYHDYYKSLDDGERKENAKLRVDMIKNMLNINP